MSLLSFRGVDAGYGRATILRNVDLAVEEGEAVAVVGRNGAGKSTLLMSIFGGTRVTKGSITMGGRERRGQPGYAAARDGASISPQGRMILPNLSVRENLLLGAASRRKGPWSLRTVFELFPILAERAGSRGTALSGGQQQMVAIGRALMSNPRLLALDEPSEGLSPVIVDDLARVLGAIRAQGTAILVVEQHLNLVRRTTSRFLALSKGEIVADGPTAAIDDPRYHGAIAL